MRITLLCLEMSLLLVRGAVASPTTAPSTDYPQVSLKSDTLRAVIYLPDAEKGFYRGPRFDWSSMIGRVEHNGHRFFAPFRVPHDPKCVDAGAGPAEEFGMDNALGYEDAGAGGTFLKIGVGLLRRRPADENKPYFFNTPYTIDGPAPWNITHGDDWIEMTQQLENDKGWGCTYTRRITLDKKEPTLLIERTLKNTGRKTIDTTFYGHNFVIIDDAPIGPAYALTLPFPIQPREPKPFEGFATFAGKTMTFTQPLGPRTSLWAELAGVRHDPQENQATIENRHTGASVTITGDSAPLKYNFYAERTAICPEAFTAIRVESGQTRTWKTTYRFATQPAAR